MFLLLFRNSNYDFYILDILLRLMYYNNCKEVITMITVNRKKLVKFMINNDIYGLAEYIDKLTEVAYRDGYTEGYTEGYHDACDNQY